MRFMMDVEEDVAAHIIYEAQVTVRLCRTEGGIFLLCGAHDNGLLVRLQHIAACGVHHHANGEIGIAPDGSLGSAVEDSAPHGLVHDHTDANGKTRARAL